MFVEIVYYFLVRSVITGKSQTEAMMYWPNDIEVNTRAAVKDSL